MRFVKWRNVLAVSLCHAVGYAENGPELPLKRGGGRRCLKRGNFCKWLIINRRILNYFLSLALATCLRTGLNEKRQSRDWRLQIQLDYLPGFRDGRVSGEG
jgi:hypothetical protein